MCSRVSDRRDVWIVRMMGEDDERTVKWDDLVERFGSANTS